MRRYPQIVDSTVAVVSANIIELVHDDRYGDSYFEPIISSNDNGIHWDDHPYNEYVKGKRLNQNGCSYWNGSSLRGYTP